MGEPYAKWSTRLGNGMLALTLAALVFAVATGWWGASLLFWLVSVGAYGAIMSAIILTDKSGPDA